MSRSGELQIRRYYGTSARAFIPEFARLRIEVFRDYPYLYDGDAAYEEKYLQTYTTCPESLVVLVFDGDRVVGASTGIPANGEVDDVRAPLAQAGYDPERVFYFGESVLLSDYRGRGLGVRFFEEREAFARSLDRIDYTAFCAVRRPNDDHPRRPTDYVPLDRFWMKRGYARHPSLRARFRWRDVGEQGETPKDMVFWFKELGRP